MGGSIGVVDFASLSPLPGGWSGETLLAESPEGPQVVRVYASPGVRGEHAQDVDAALLRLVRGLVPVPEVVDVRRPDDASGMPGLLVTRFVDGARGDVLLPSLDVDAQARLGRHIGDLVARLGGMPQPRAGRFVDRDLTVSAWEHEESDGLEGYVDAHLEQLTWWSPQERAGLVAVAADAQDVLDSVTRVCLVHGDLNPKNWLVDPETLEVTALLDWELAHAGHPATDLGNALRFERTPSYAAAVLRAYCDRLGGEPAEALGLARSADLWALVDLACRPGADPVTQRADELLRAIAQARDVHAVA